MVPAKKPEGNDADGPDIGSRREPCHFSFGRKPADRAACAWLRWYVPVWSVGGVVEVEEDNRRPVFVPASDSNVVRLDISVDPTVGMEEVKAVKDVLDHVVCLDESE